MGAPIGSGDFIECVDASRHGFGNWEPGAALTVGAVYIVTAVFANPRGEPAVELKEVRRGPEAALFWGGRTGYRADRFRPIYRPNADMIASLKAPPITAPPQRVTEDA